MAFLVVSNVNLVSDKADGPEGGAPLLKLVHPVGQGRFGHKDHVRPINVPSCKLSQTRSTSTLESYE